MKTRKGLLALLLAMCLLLTACGGSPQSGEATPAPSAGGESPAPSEAPSASPAPSAAPSGGEEVEGFTVGVTSLPTSLDPAAAQTVEALTVVSHTGEGLMRWSDSGNLASASADLAKLTYGAAERYEKTEAEGEDEEVTYTFYLREDACWSDGLPVTAQDFVYAWRRAADPSIRAFYAFFLQRIKNGAEVVSGHMKPEELGVEAVEDKVFSVTLSHDDPSFLEVCAHPVTFPVRADAVDKGSSQNVDWSADPEIWVGNGRYCLQYLRSYDAIILTPNEKYYEEVTGPETITFAYAMDNASLMNYANNGTVNFAVAAISSDAYELEEPPQQEGVKAMTDSVPYAGLYYLSFQTDLAPFDDPRVREAFTLAVDREKLLREVVGYGMPATGFVPHGVYDKDGGEGPDFRKTGGDYYDPATYEANRARAKELLAEAGYPGGVGFPTVTYVYNATDTHRKIAVALLRMWREAFGITINIKGVDWTEYLTSGEKGEIHMIKRIWMANLNDPAAFLEMFMEDNGSWYANEELDELIEEAAEEKDPAKRMSILHHIEDQALGQDWAVCPLYSYTRDYTYTEGMTGLYYSPMGIFFFDGVSLK